MVVAAGVVVVAEVVVAGPKVVGVLGFRFRV